MVSRMLFSLVGVFLALAGQLDAKHSVDVRGSELFVIPLHHSNFSVDEPGN